MALSGDAPVWLGRSSSSYSLIVANGVQLIGNVVLFCFDRDARSWDLRGFVRASADLSSASGKPGRRIASLLQTVKRILGFEG